MKLDPVALEVFHHRLAAVADEMGAILARSGHSPNIKEREDFSCAVFDAKGALVAQAAHIPVHLASTSTAVRAAIERRPMGPGDVVLVNDPFAGGTHLPDCTVIAPVHVKGSTRPVAYVADRAHHADIGGQAPGSMSIATEIQQEGFRIPPVRLIREGELDEDVMALFLANTRVPAEREGDLRAQVAALRTGARRLVALVDDMGLDGFDAATRDLQTYAARLMRATIREIPDGSWTARDWIDDDGAGRTDVPIAVRIEISGARAKVDFSESGDQVRGSLNTNRAVTLSATFYVFKCLAHESLPPNDGLLRPIELITRAGTIVDARPPAAVSAGNVETSQRIVDVLFRALANVLPDRVPAASAGTMTNLAIGGVGGTFAYYETIAGGAGAGRGRPGASAIQTHMTNTGNTPIEALEAAYPLRVTSTSIRRGSGGSGRSRGGDGLVREIECLEPSIVSIVTERRRRGPWGLSGGKAGTPGRARRFRGKTSEDLPAKGTFTATPGDRFRLETPGGGGHGSPPARRKKR